MLELRASEIIKYRQMCLQKNKHGGTLLRGMRQEAEFKARTARAVRETTLKNQ